MKRSRKRKPGPRINGNQNRDWPSSRHLAPRMTGMAPQDVFFRNQDIKATVVMYRHYSHPPPDPEWEPERIMQGDEFGFTLDYGQDPDPLKDHLKILLRYKERYNVV